MALYVETIEASIRKNSQLYASVYGGCFVRYEVEIPDFKEHLNFSFAINYESNLKMYQTNMMVSPKQKKTMGVFYCFSEKPGKIRLLFHNQQWFNSVIVQYKLSIIEPIGKSDVVEFTPYVIFTNDVTMALSKSFFVVKSTKVTLEDCVASGKRIFACITTDLEKAEAWSVSTFGLRLSKLSLLPNKMSPFFISEPSPTTIRSTKPKLVLGTMCIEPGELEKSMRQFITVGGFEIDTAASYKGVEVPQGTLRVAGKVNPFGGKKLIYEEMKKQIVTSLRELKIKRFDILYLHAPDYSTPIETTLKDLNRINKELNCFSEFGLSNFSASLVMQIHHVCLQNNYVPVTVYQGPYNMINRLVEEELLPCLKALNIKFYAYNPLNGGLLTSGGRYDFLIDSTNSSKGLKMVGGRFDANSELGVKYRERYWKASILETIRVLNQTISQVPGLTLQSAALRWLTLYSKLDFEKGDAVVLGCSRCVQLNENLVAIQSNQPLESIIIHVASECAKKVKKDMPEYFR